MHGTQSMNTSTLMFESLLCSVCVCLFMAPSLPIPKSWMKLPCQAAVETPQKATRHGSDKETHVSEGDTSIGIQDIEQTLAPKVRDQERALARPPFKNESFIEQLEQALEHEKLKGQTPLDQKIPPNAESKHEIHARLLQHQGFGSVLSESSSLGNGEARKEDHPETDTNTRNDENVMHRWCPSTFRYVAVTILTATQCFVLTDQQLRHHSFHAVWPSGRPEIRASDHLANAMRCDLVCCTQ